MRLNGVEKLSRLLEPWPCGAVFDIPRFWLKNAVERRTESYIHIRSLPFFPFTDMPYDIAERCLDRRTLSKSAERSELSAF